jgi:hypothetical protein
MKNLRRLALISGIAAVFSAVAFNPKAQAETKDINFSGTIARICTFGANTDGVLAAGDGWVEGTTGIPSLNTGTAGSITLTCNGYATVSAGLPVRLSAPIGFIDPHRQSVIYDTETQQHASNYTGTRFWTNYYATNMTIPADTSRTFKVGMSAGSQGTAGNVVAGTYSYKVTVTATPN